MQQPEERIQTPADKLLFVAKSSNAPKSEMLGVFISSFDEVSKRVFKDFMSFGEVSPPASENPMAALAAILKDQDMDIKQIRRPKLIRYPRNFQPALLLRPPVYLALTNML